MGKIHQMPRRLQIRVSSNRARLEDQLEPGQHNSLISASRNVNKEGVGIGANPATTSVACGSPPKLPRKSSLSKMERPVNTFFVVRKSRASAELQASKKRKVEVLQANTTEVCDVTSSLLDENVSRLGTANSSKLFSTPTSHSKSNNTGNTRRSKRDLFDQIKEDIIEDGNDTQQTNALTKLFNTGTDTKDVKKSLKSNVKGSNAKRRLKMTSTSSSKQPSIVPFLKLAQLSPKKSSGPSKKIPMSNTTGDEDGLNEKEEGRTEEVNPKSTVPKKSETTTMRSREMDSVAQKIEKSSGDKRAEIKKRLKGVSNLAELQARLKAVSKKMSDETGPSSSKAPSLSKKPITVEVSSPVKQLQTEGQKSIATSKLVLASPKKLDVESEDEFLALIDRQPNKRLELPDKYEELAKCFAHFDQIACIRYNRRQAVRVEGLLRDVQKVRRRDFKQTNLQQMHCVFPQAHKFSWERIGQSLRQSFELQCTPNAHYKADLIRSIRESNRNDDHSTYAKKEHRTLTAKDLTLRSKVFRANLLALVEEEHHKFVNENLDLNLDKCQKVAAWHPNFIPNELCPDIEPALLPPKPFAEVVHSARDALQQNRVIKTTESDDKLMSINPKLVKATRRLMTEECNESPSELTTTISRKTVDSQRKEPQVIKGLEGLSKSLLSRVLAKEKEKQLRDMLRPKYDTDDFAFLDKLQDLSTPILNCYRQKRVSGAMELVAFSTFVSDSLIQVNGKEEAEKMIRRLSVLVPKYVQIKRFQRAEFVRMADHNDDNDGLREGFHSTLTNAIKLFKNEKKKEVKPSTNV